MIIQLAGLGLLARRGTTKGLQSFPLPDVIGALFLILFVIFAAVGFA
jgi:hypothetical protein